ncbi:hypothetical protein PUN28_008034 [Cardiocondyla obscurior]|uniref:Uncharacterized protein n=1 Tax=Cardiocondyla obscurior TaxID=286306 RepID=A0AAW2FXT2_9HYME
MCSHALGSILLIFITFSFSLQYTLRTMRGICSLKFSSRSRKRSEEREKR